MPLKVSAGPNYNELTSLRVNNETPTTIESEHATVKVVVRIRNYHDVECEQPTNSPYFDVKDHHATQLSIQFGVKLNESVDGDALLFGNDFAKPIRDMLPYGFSVAFNAFKWIDPSVDGDVYADQPYLYGRALSSINTIEKNSSVEAKDDWWYGGANCNYTLVENMCDAEDKDEKSCKTAVERSKYFVSKDNRDKVELDPDHIYTFDFCTPYLTMGDRFSIQLPGFKYDVGKYCGSQPLRYVLKNSTSEVVYLVVQFEVEP